MYRGIIYFKFIEYLAGVSKSFKILKMKIEQVHIDQIRKQFAEMQSKGDLVKLLNSANKILYGEKCKPIQLKSLTYYANPSICKKRYQTFTIKKKSGAERIIHSPVKGLKSILRSLNFVLQCVYEPHDAATGFVLGKSIVDNAKKHVGHRYVFNLDLKDFFYSFDRNRVKLVFMNEPFNLKGDKERIAFLLASLCTHPIGINGEIIPVLPQGSPTSPTLTNILCKKLDRRLEGLASRFGATYSRYADDITFSSPHNIYKDKKFLNELNRIIKEDNLYKFKDKIITIGPELKINPQKIRLQKSDYRQEVTGLIVNEKVNIRRRYIKQIRMWLYYWEKYGYEKAEQIFKKDYNADKGHVKKSNPCLANVLEGKLQFIKIVKGSEDGTYKGLKERFDKLTGKSKPLKLDLNEEKINVENKTAIVNKVSTDITQYPIIHKPLKTIEILKYFTRNDKHLKYTTHSWEKNKYLSYDDFIKKIKKEWKLISESLKELSPRLHAKISNFLFNESLGQKNEKGYNISWGEKQLCFGWSSPALKEFMKNNQHENPFNCPIPTEIKEIDKQHNLNFFRDYVNVFKNEIEFREDTKNLRKMFAELWESELSYDFNVSGLESMEGFSFFTDIHQVKDAIKKIFEMFAQSDYRYFSEIILEHFSNFSSKPNYHLIRISQKYSYIKRDIADPKIIRPSGNLGSIINLLKNLTDYSIVSRFIDGECYRINYLSSVEKNQIEKINCDTAVYGFTHELKFYI